MVVSLHIESDGLQYGAQRYAFTVWFLWPKLILADADLSYLLNIQLILLAIRMRSDNLGVE